jgi:hypothetical protein
MISLTSIILCALFVKEVTVALSSYQADQILTYSSQTLPSKVAAQKLDGAETSPTSSANVTIPPGTIRKPIISTPEPPGPPQRLSIFKLFAISQVRLIMTSTFLLTFLAIAFEIVFVLHSYTSVELGGLGRSVCLSLPPALH